MAVRGVAGSGVMGKLIQTGVRRSDEEKLRAANPQIKKAGAGACHAWCGSARRRFGSKHPRHSTWRRGREVAWSATENDAAAGEF